MAGLAPQAVVTVSVTALVETGFVKSWGMGTGKEAECLKR